MHFLTGVEERRDFAGIIATEVHEFYPTSQKSNIDLQVSDGSLSPAGIF